MNRRYSLKILLSAIEVRSYFNHPPHPPGLSPPPHPPGNLLFFLFGVCYFPYISTYFSIFDFIPPEVSIYLYVFFSFLFFFFGGGGYPVGQQLLAHFALEELGLSRIVFSQICERDKLAEYALSAIRAQQDGVQVAQKVAAILPISTPWSDEIIAAAEPVGTLQDLRSGVEAVYAHVLGYTASTIADENGVLSHERLSSTSTKDAENDVGVVAAVGTAVARHPDLEGAVYARPSTRSSSVTQILNNEREAVAGKVDGGAWLYDNAKKKGKVKSHALSLFVLVFYFRGKRETIVQFNPHYKCMKLM